VTMKPKLVYIIDNLKLSGAQVHLFNLVKGITEIGYNDIEVISLSEEGEIADWIAQYGIEVCKYNMKSIRKPIFFAEMARLVMYLLKKKPDIVHTYLDTANVFGVLAAKCAGVKRIMTSRRDLGVFRTRQMEILIGMISNRVEKVVCVCKMAAKESIRREKLHGNNIKVVYNGIAVDNFKIVEKNIDVDSPVFCNVAVPDRKEKGHADLIDAFALVLQSKPKAKLRLVGDGCLLPQLKERAHDLKIAEHIDFFGKSLDIPAVMKDVTSFVIPSHSEGISNALLEAMAMGIPAVATNVGGNAEVVDDSVTGILVEARNPEAIAQGMLKLVNNPETLVKMGIASRERVMTAFSYANMIGEYDSLYRAGH